MLFSSVCLFLCLSRFYINIRQTTRTVNQIYLASTSTTIITIRHIHQKNTNNQQAPTFLEHIRLQLHLARARIAHPQPWHIDARDPVAGNLVSSEPGT